MNRSIAIGLLAAALAAAAGCAKQPPTHPQPQRTHGTLTYNGKPLKGAVVQFWPLPLENVTWRTLKPAAWPMRSAVASRATTRGEENDPRA